MFIRSNILSIEDVDDLLRNGGEYVSYQIMVTAEDIRCSHCHLFRDAACTWSIQSLLRTIPCFIALQY